MHTRYDLHGADVENQDEPKFHLHFHLQPHDHHGGNKEYTDIQDNANGLERHKGQDLIAARPQDARVPLGRERPAYEEYLNSGRSGEAGAEDHDRDDRAVSPLDGAEDLERQQTGRDAEQPGYQGPQGLGDEQGLRGRLSMSADNAVRGNNSCKVDLRFSASLTFAALSSWDAETFCWCSPWPSSRIVHVESETRIVPTRKDTRMRISSAPTRVDLPKSLWEKMEITDIKAKRVRVQLTTKVQIASEVYWRIVVLCFCGMRKINH